MKKMISYQNFITIYKLYIYDQIETSLTTQKIISEILGTFSQKCF